MDIINIFWFRRDLRLEDNAGLFHALKSGRKVLPLFIFDISILDKLESKNDKRINFIYRQISKLKRSLELNGNDIMVLYDNPLAAFRKITDTYSIEAVFCNEDYEPYAIERDEEIKVFLQTKSIRFESFKDQLIFGPSEILKEDGRPYTVFTPYGKKWKALLKENPLKQYPSEKQLSGLQTSLKFEMPSLYSLGFEACEAIFPSSVISEQILINYAEQRDLPALDATSRLGMHLRFGSISIRSLIPQALHHSEAWLNELIWREFFMQILFHFQHVVNTSFKPQYDRIEWRNEAKEFEQWCRGETGYPLVDAGMHELNSTGFMHNRVRMVAASFLCKHLLIDWRLGEAWFAQKLLDYELSSNNGNWQWAAGTGCDAAPYFRIFNPLSQQQKFDPDFLYIKKWISGFREEAYLPKIVDHSFARERCLKAYKTALLK